MDFYNLETYSSLPAIFQSTEKKYSYSDLACFCAQWENCIAPRDLVFILCGNNLESIVGYLACLRKRGVAVLLDENIHQTFLQNLISLYGPSHILAPKGRQDLQSVGDPLSSFGSYTLRGAFHCEKSEIHPDLAVLISTSGSTGSPKLVRISYQNLQSNACSIRQYLKISNDDRAITTLPMSYSYGLSIINSHLVSGASIILTELSVVERSFWDLLNGCEATNFGGVPFTYELLKRLKFEKMNLPSLKHITQAGGRLDPALTKYFLGVCAEKNILFYTMYGQTEATARMSYVDPHRGVEALGSIGKPIPNGELWIEADNGARVNAPNCEGELVYRGPNVSMGYSQNRDDLKLPDQNSGVLYTGDLAEQTENGDFVIVGRKSRFFKVFGNRVNLDELQGLMEARGHEAVCLGWRDQIIVFLMGESDSLQEELSELTGIHYSAFLLKEIDEIPRTSTGKINFGELEARVRND